MEANIQDIKQCLNQLTEEPQGTNRCPEREFVAVSTRLPAEGEQTALAGTTEHVPIERLLYNGRLRRRAQVALPSVIIHRKPKKHKPAERLEFEGGTFIVTSSTEANCVSSTDSHS